MKPTERALPFLLAALLILLWTLAIASAREFESAAVGVSARWLYGVSPSELVRVERRIAADGGEPADITLYDTRGAVTFTLGDREADAELALVYGDAEAVEPSGFVSGAHPPRGDEAVSISVPLAEMLFGSSDIVGAEVAIDGVKYTVRGVFDSRSARAIAALPDDSTEKLTRALINTDEGVDAAAALLNLYGFPNADLCDLSLTAWFADAMAAIPAALMLLLVLAKLFGRGLRLRFYPMLLIGYLPLALLTAAGLFIAAGAPFDIPARLIPSRYSDFEFWGRVFSQSIGALINGFAQNSDSRALGQMSALCKTALFGVAAAVVVPIWLRRAAGSTDRIAVCASTGAAAVVMLLIFRLPANRALLFLPTVCVAVCSTLNHKEVTEYEEAPQV